MIKTIIITPTETFGINDKLEVVDWFLASLSVGLLQDLPGGGHQLIRHLPISLTLLYNGCLGGSNLSLVSCSSLSLLPRLVFHFCVKSSEDETEGW